MRHYRLIVGLLVLVMTAMLVMAAVTLVNGPVNGADPLRSVPVTGPAIGPGLTTPLPNAPLPGSTPVWL